MALPNYLTQDAATYKANIDASFNTAFPGGTAAQVARIGSAETISAAWNFTGSDATYSTAGILVTNGILLGQNTVFGANAYYSSGWKYQANGPAGFIKFAESATVAANFYVATNNAGGAGAAMSPSGALTLYTNLDAGFSGNVLVGAASAPASLAKGMVIAGSTDASANPTDGIAAWAKDWNGAGTRWLYVRTEEGNTGYVPVGASPIDWSTGRGWPSVWAYRNAGLSAQNFTTATEIVFDAEVYDTNSNFNTTNGRFTPTVAGKFPLFAQIVISNWAPGSTGGYIEIRKNGSTASAGDVVRGYFGLHDPSTTAGSARAFGAFDMNGTTDYLSVFIEIQTDTSVDVQTGAQYSYMSGGRWA